jgi:diguanylate cyclase
MDLRIKSKREVWIFTAVLSIATILIPVISVIVAFGLSPAGLSAPYVPPLLAIAVSIPLFITPPIAYVVLNMIRRHGDMIKMVNARIMFDMLTGVYNRNHFLDNIRASEAGGAIMIVDADHFKAINDSHGHAVGDEALRILANAIQQCVGDDGIVGRLGGEEFGIFLVGKSESQGFEKAESICAAVRGLQPLILGKPVKLTVSIGCTYHRVTRVIGHSMKLADDLLYRAKAEGRDRVVYAGDHVLLKHSA